MFRLISTIPPIAQSSLFRWPRHHWSRKICSDGGPSAEKALLGRKMMQKFFGEDVVEKILKSRDDNLTKTFQDYAAEVCFSSYARPGLTFRDRSLMNIAMLIALNRAPELRIHIRTAAKNGMTEEEICEACRHAMVYCGIPAGKEAFLIASDVLREMREAGETPASSGL